MHLTDQKNPRILESAGAFFRHMRHGHGTLYLPERNMEELDQVCGSFFIHSCMILYGPFFLGWINLVGGLEQLLFFRILGIIIPID